MYLHSFSSARERKLLTTSETCDNSSDGFDAYITFHSAVVDLFFNNKPNFVHDSFRSYQNGIMQNMYMYMLSLTSINKSHSRT